MCSDDVVIGRHVAQALWLKHTEVKGSTPNQSVVAQDLDFAKTLKEVVHEEESRAERVDNIDERVEAIENEQREAAQ